MIRTKELFKALINKLKESKPNIRKYTLAGTEVLAFPGTIRTKPDKDDNWYYHIAKEASSIIDIGCNVGYSGLLAIAAGEDKKFVFIDANTQALSIAATHIIYNGYSHKSSFVNSLVGNKNGEKHKFYTIGTGAAGSIYKDHARSAELTNSWYWVESKTLDDICAQLNFEPDLVKIDVEGVEAMVLGGAKRITAKFLPDFFIEMHKTKELSMHSNASRVLDWCDDNGYLAWYLSKAVRISKPEEIADRGRCHILLRPENKDYPISLENIREGSDLPS